MGRGMPNNKVIAIFIEIYIYLARSHHEASTKLAVECRVRRR